MNIPDIENFNSFRDLSFFQLKKVCQAPKQLANLIFDSSVKSNNTLKSIVRLQAAVHRLDANIKNPFQPSFCRRFLDVITFQFIKVWVLRKILPILITTIDDIVAKNSVFPKNPSSLEDKLDLTLKANADFQATKLSEEKLYGNDPEWISTAMEVDEYFNGIITRLSSQENVPLPMWWHATKAQYVDPIAKEAKLKQADAPLGRGVYFSTRDESHGAYGPFTFAVDESLISSCQASYFRGSPQLGNEETGLWVRVEEDVPLSATSIAFLVATNETAKVEKKQKFWQDFNLGGVETITRRSSDWIRKSFTAVHQHQLPMSWRRHERFRFSSPNLKHIHEVYES